MTARYVFWGSGMESAVEQMVGSCVLIVDVPIVAEHRVVEPFLHGGGLYS